MILELTHLELCRRLQNAHDAEQLNTFYGIDAIVVVTDANDVAPCHSPQCPVLVHSGVKYLPKHIDAVANNDDELNALTQSIQDNPIASQCLVQLLRLNETVSIKQAVQAESLTYSTLQHGSEFNTWLSTHTRRKRQVVDPGPAMISTREGACLTIVFNRPSKRNAWSVEMRDSLLEQIEAVEIDPSIRKVFIRGKGPCFSAGGDLDEFGLARDAAEAHLTRQVRSPALMLEQVRERVTFHVHGACVGAGIELPAFATRVTASPDAFFCLPEVSMGLVPGAGGTASILRRIGRHHLTKMAITGEHVSAERALQWQLIDEITTVE